LDKRDFEVDFEDHHVTKLLRVAESQDRQFSLVWTYLCHGLRFGEAVGEKVLPGLQVQDFYWNEGLVKFQGKGFDSGKADLVFQPVHPALLDATQRFKNRDNGKLFSIPPRTLRYYFKRHCKKAGIPGWEEAHPHRLRHWFANAIRPYARDEFEVMGMLRHSKKGLQRIFGATIVYMSTPVSRRRELTLKALEPILGN
jgi:integrase